MATLEKYSSKIPFLCTYPNQNEDLIIGLIYLLKGDQKKGTNVLLFKDKNIVPRAKLHYKGQKQKFQVLD